MDIIIVVLLALITVTLVIGVLYVRRWSQKFVKQQESLNRIEKSDRLESLTVQLDKVSKSLLSLESESVEQWIQTIQNLEDDTKRLEYVEAAASRFPAEKRFVEEIREILNPLVKEGENLLVKREALMRLRKHANRFSNNCDMCDFDYANTFRDDVLESMESVVKRIDELREQNLKKQLKELESNVNKVKKKSSSNGLLEEIEKIDAKIDQTVLGNYPKLNAKYDDLSKDLITVLNKSEKESKTDLKKYNEDVLKNAKKVIQLIKNHSDGNVKDKFFGPDEPVNYNQKKNLTKLLKLIANHDSNKLHPSVSNYVRMTEAEVFNKLSPEGKILFTELMIKEAHK